MTPAAERQLLVEVRWLLMRLEQISGNLGLMFMIRYDDDDLGWIGHGVTDDAVRQGLIAVWERDLQRLERHSP